MKTTIKQANWLEIHQPQVPLSKGQLPPKKQYDGLDLYTPPPPFQVHHVTLTYGPKYQPYTAEFSTKTGLDHLRHLTHNKTRDNPIASLR